MKTKKFFMFAVLVALGFTACTEMDDMPGSAEKSNVPVRLTATTLTADVTRAAQNLNEGYITSGENITVKVGSSTYTYQAGAAGALTDITGESASDKAYYPAEGSVDIYAWYPQGASTSGSVNADQTSDANYKASDVMFASPGSFTKAQGATPVALAFDHKMAKIEVNVTAGAGVGAVTGVTLKNVNRAYNFNQTTGAVTTSGSTKSDITMTNNGAVVFPAQTHGASALLAITTEGGTATYTLDASKEFQAGKRYVMNITVTAQAVGATTSIGAWSADAGVINVGSQGELTIAAIAAQTYNGSAKEPALTVTDGSTPLTLNTHYKAIYTNNTNAGTATVTAVGIGTYAGKVGVKEFTINKATYPNPTYLVNSESGSTLRLVTSTTGTLRINNTAIGGGNITVAVSDGSTNVVSNIGWNSGTDTYSIYNVAAGSTTGSKTLNVTISDNPNYNDKTWENAVTVNVVTGLTGQFTINAGGTKVVFAHGNLQAVFAAAGSSCTWRFADHQYDYIGDGGGNKLINGNGTVSGAGTVDLFGFVGNSSTVLNSNPAWYGISNSTTNSDYGATTGEGLKKDWGNVSITNGGGFSWRTLTGAEWIYLFNTRSASTVGGTSNGRYTKAVVNGKNGVILFPDSYTHPAGITAPVSVNSSSANFTVNSYDLTAWGKMEDAGCVFLPAAGYRSGTTVGGAGSEGNYWASKAHASNASYACYVYFSGSNLAAQNFYNNRSLGESVRLVRQVGSN